MEPMTATQAETARTETVAVLGAGGTMGFPIAPNIARAGMPVRAWNRSRDKAEALAKDDIYVAGSPADAARGAGIVVTMLADEDAAIDGPDGALEVMASADRGSAELANRAGVGFVDAPVLGTRQPAEEGKLVVLESGPQEARPRTQPVFDAIGQRTIWAGEAGAGTRLKLVTNSWVLAVVEAGAETIALAEGAGEHGDKDFSATYLTSTPRKA
jgi:3-hydroxyisobutyrate dehydrogenase